MTSLFVKGLLLKSTADEEYSSTNLKQRRRCENGVLRVLDHHLQRPFLQWIRHGNLSIARRTESRIGGAVPLRAVLNPVSPPVMTTKKVCMNLRFNYRFRICKFEVFECMFVASVGFYGSYTLGS